MLKKLTGGIKSGGKSGEKKSTKHVTIKEDSVTIIHLNDSTMLSSKQKFLSNQSSDQSSSSLLSSNNKKDSKKSSKNVKKSNESKHQIENGGLNSGRSPPQRPPPPPPMMTTQQKPDEHWHVEHFCCVTCGNELAGDRYVVHHERPYCVTCFEQQHSNVCDECQKPIGINSKDLSYKERHWHEKCFVCCVCKKSLLHQQFGSKMDRIYCGDCYDENFGVHCEKCAQLFRPGQRKLEYRGKQWHDQCFVCHKCSIPIGTKNFVPKNNDEIYCSECYEVKFATRCVKCCEIITNGVMFKDDPWHRECFTCTDCDTALADASFLVRDDRPYCRQCFAQKYSHKCVVCLLPIVGFNTTTTTTTTTAAKTISGEESSSTTTTPTATPTPTTTTTTVVEANNSTQNTTTRFINYEELYWHADCFTCADCHQKLEGKGFIRDGASALCGECAKIRLWNNLKAELG